MLDRSSHNQFIQLCSAFLLSFLFFFDFVFFIDLTGIFFLLFIFDDRLKTVVMSILMAGGRSATARRFSQATLAANGQIRHESLSAMGRRRALDLYGTKDVVFTHEYLKRNKQNFSSFTASKHFGWENFVSLFDSENLPIEWIRSVHLFLLLLFNRRTKIPIGELDSFVTILTIHWSWASSSSIVSKGGKKTISPFFSSFIFISITERIVKRVFFYFILLNKIKENQNNMIEWWVKNHIDFYFVTFNFRCWTSRERPFRLVYFLHVWDELVISNNEIDSTVDHRFNVDKIHHDRSNLEKIVRFSNDSISCWKQKRRRENRPHKRVQIFLYDWTRIYCPFYWAVVSHWLKREKIVEFQYQWELFLVGLDENQWSLLSSEFEITRRCQFSRDQSCFAFFDRRIYFECSANQREMLLFYSHFSRTMSWKLINYQMTKNTCTIREMRQIFQG